MELKFHLENSSIVLIIKDENGTILKSSCRLEEDFYNMIPLGDDVYFDNNSNRYWKKNIITFVEDSNTYYQEEYINVTDLLLEKEQLLDNLKKDPLTKISNLNAVNEMQNQIKLSGRNCIIVMCDVNDFKTVNDVYGHMAGDRALIELANLFRQSIRNEDLVARVGGDEFFFIFLSDDMKAILNKMADIQEKTVELGQILSLPLSISIGVSSYKNDEQWDSKKKEADAALYCVKNNTLDKNHIAYVNRETGSFELYEKQVEDVSTIRY